MKNYYLIIYFFVFISTVFSQSKFENFNFLIGNWQGVETGVAGNGIGFRTYTYELNDNYIMEKNQSTFPITEKKPKGEVHRDIGIFSYNANTNETIYRSFNVEGFTNIFVLDSVNSTRQKFVFITREIENNPGNWKARVIIEKISAEEFIETFDIAMNGVNYEDFISNHWYKVK